MKINHTEDNDRHLEIDVGYTDNCPDGEKNMNEDSCLVLKGNTVK